LKGNAYVEKKHGE